MAVTRIGASIVLAAEGSQPLGRMRLLTFRVGIRILFNDGTCRRDPPRDSPTTLWTGQVLIELAGVDQEL